MKETTRKTINEAMEEALHVLMLCDPEGERVKAFGRSVPEDAEVRALCERHGYGAVIDSATRQWRMKDAIGAFTSGPCVLTVQNGVKRLRAALRLLKTEARK